MITIYLTPDLSFEVTEEQLRQAIDNRLRLYPEQLRDSIYASKKRGILEMLVEAVG